DLPGGARIAFTAAPQEPETRAETADRHEAQPDLKEEPGAEDQHEQNRAPDEAVDRVEPGLKGVHDGRRLYRESRARGADSSHAIAADGRHGGPADTCEGRPRFVPRPSVAGCTAFGPTHPA